MNVAELISSQSKTAFSIEVLPPLKGKGIGKLFSDIEALREFSPLYINITTHQSERVFKETKDGLFLKQEIRRRPGTVAIAAAIAARYGIKVVPHVICSGHSMEDTEYELLDLQYLGITDLLVLRGDKAKEGPSSVPLQADTAMPWTFSIRCNASMKASSWTEAAWKNRRARSAAVWPATPRSTRRQPTWKATSGCSSSNRMQEPSMP